MNLRSRIKNDFTYHPPKEGQPQKYEDMRAAALLMAQLLLLNVPEGRELSVALTKLDEVVFWANAGIARNNG